jgi:hypothetical protein
MPNYGFKCRECDFSFEVTIIGRSQADCKRAVPNMKRAVCPKCHKIVDERDYNGTRINKRFIKSWESVVSLLGRPTYDPTFERLSVDGGRNDRKVFVGSSPATDEDIAVREANKVTIFTDIICDCEFCSPKEKVQTDGELRQMKTDKELADIMLRGSLDGKRLHKDAAYHAKTHENHIAFQQFLADPEPSIPDVED